MTDSVVNGVAAHIRDLDRTGCRGGFSGNIAVCTIGGVQLGKVGSKSTGGPDYLWSIYYRFHTVPIPRSSSTFAQDGRGLIYCLVEEGESL
jgi:hypothetical protein